MVRKQSFSMSKGRGERGREGEGERGRGGEVERGREE
jgi:hypothetical protein